MIKCIPYVLKEAQFMGILDVRKVGLLPIRAYETLLTPEDWTLVLLEAGLPDKVAYYRRLDTITAMKGLCTTYAYAAGDSIYYNHCVASLNRLKLALTASEDMRGVLDWLESRRGEQERFLCRANRKKV